MDSIEVRSFRRVFVFERRLYRLDGLRLNPAGIPLRSIAYFLVLLLAVLALDALPLIGAVVRVAPWYLREALLPGIGAFALTSIRVDARPVHLAAPALLRSWMRPRRGVSL